MRSIGQPSAHAADNAFPARFASSGSVTVCTVYIARGFRRRRTHMCNRFHCDRCHATQSCVLLLSSSSLSTASSITISFDFFLGGHLTFLHSLNRRFSSLFIMRHANHHERES